MYFTISSFLHTAILPFLGSTSRQYVFLELMAGVEPATSSLPRMRSTTELHQQHRIGSATARKYERIKKSSGKRGSNPRPPAWKASALSTELFPRINHDFRDGYFFVGADGFEPPKVKTSRFTVCPIWPLWNTPNTYYFKVQLFLSLLSDSNQRPRDYKSRALAN